MFSDDSFNALRRLTRLLCAFVLKVPGSYFSKIGSSEGLKYLHQRFVRFAAGIGTVVCVKTTSKSQPRMGASGAFCCVRSPTEPNVRRWDSSAVQQYQYYCKKVRHAKNEVAEISHPDSRHLIE